MVPGGTDRILTYAKKYLPVLWEAQRIQYKKVGYVLLPSFLDLLVGWMKHSDHKIAISGMQLLQVRSGALFPILLHLLIDLIQQQH